MDWSERIGRRVKLRDLHMLLAVGQYGSMTRAAERLAISHSVISKTISELELVLHARLLDRTSQGADLTECGRALAKCATSVFDELRRGIQDVELICDPTRGEVRIGANTALMDGLIPAAVARLTLKYPQIKVHALEGDGPQLYDLLRERKVDFVIARRLPTINTEDVTARFLFDEPMFVVSGSDSRWARRRKIAFSELAGEHWVLPDADNFFGELLLQLFRSAGIERPDAHVVSGSVSMRSRLVESGDFLTLFPGSMLHFDRKGSSLKVLRVNPPLASHPIEVISLKNRALSGVAERLVFELQTLSRDIVRPRSRVGR